MTDGVTPDAEKKINQNYNVGQIPSILREGNIIMKSLSGNVRGDIDNNIKITEYHSNSLDNVTALVSPTFNISNEMNDSIYITFDVTNISERIQNLMVVKYVDGELIPIETDFEENTITAKVENGIYGIVDCDYIVRELNIFVSDYIEE